MSNKFKSINILHIYEINGTKYKQYKNDTPEFIVSEHWNKKQFVDIKVNGQTYTILADELKRAINNAQNAHN